MSGEREAVSGSLSTAFVSSDGRRDRRMSPVTDVTEEKIADSIGIPHPRVRVSWSHLLKSRSSDPIIRFFHSDRPSSGPLTAYRSPLTWFQTLWKPTRPALVPSGAS